ncbi:MerR family transcriptional regulator [Urechidicola croceus]|uniref:MerR family transcriptional regulator n=1 Tax=Urechidicola croceus TaxID=1850246 RepID=A0A1D8PBJ8_9FLAO|nr:MerR family transcriptional regulator [Urechidicola croceus]AOW21957.1 MerR family transcriptional regulator [Urechidicola croceus]
MNNIKSEFTIKDLENFSGIKAHTIRIWEKRYNLLQPNRTDSNIRYYNIDNLLKLLNVSLLNNNGLKISKIAQLDEQEIAIKVREQAYNKGNENQALNSFKLSMLNFDEGLFNQTYNKLLVQSSFRDIFKNIFIPFLEQIGVLWQVNSITPAHEHFITNLIKHKMHVNIERLQNITNLNHDKVFVLYLPSNEIHELGLLYLHFELLLHGYKSIFLGQSVPLENLNDLQGVYKNITFIVYLTVEPSKESVLEYLDRIERNVLNGTIDSLWAIGAKIRNLDTDKIKYKNISAFKSIDELLKVL